jgi:hypothetical protein
MQQFQQSEQQRKRRGIDLPWDSPPRRRRRRKIQREPQLALRFTPAYDPERPLNDLFPEAHAADV